MPGRVILILMDGTTIDVESDTRAIKVDGHKHVADQLREFLEASGRYMTVGTPEGSIVVDKEKIVRFEVIKDTTPRVMPV